jgi:pyruvate/2-oxoglutarate dehydrogenase complex dihydrolipoamide acyltransferase (E2) component
MVPSLVDRIERLPLTERWFADARAVAGHPGGVVERIVDVTWAMPWLEAQSAAGLAGTMTHLIVRAVAIALARNPHLHQTVCGYRTLTPGSVDIGLTVPEATTTMPVVLRSVDDKPLLSLIPAMDLAITSAREAETRTLEAFRRFAWLVPFGFLRRILLRWAQKSFWFRRRIAGTFQVSVTCTADLAVPLRFHTGSLLAAGRVRDLVVAVDGQLEVRRMMTLALIVDHVAMDGVRASTLLGEIAATLEGDELACEVGMPSIIPPALPAPPVASGLRLA